MIVDDSAVIRGLVTRWLNEVGEFEIVATASNGRLALETLNRCEPDVILLDLEMPEMDGVDALPQLLRRRPGVKVVVVSTLTQRNAQISLKCLSLGAADYLAKPEGQRNPTAVDEFRRDLVEKLKALAPRRGRISPEASAPTPARPSFVRKPAASRPQCLLIGASTGGPRAVERVLISLGAAIKQIPILVVQHMPAMFTGVFAEHLRAQTGVHAYEPADGEPVKAGTVFIAPGGRHMGLVMDRGNPVVRLDDSAPVNFCRPAVDVLFRDAATIYGGATLAVVLTGMGSDGTQGARHLVQAGGTVLAQDESTSIVWGMPGSIAKAGLAQEILPLEAIGPALKNYITGSTP
ncbi:protein-glutamate methylesterase/protein-glutamine glutaminase [Microvirga rosea]|uniref:protein-glutamate methylesterase/protein-glutamine glutaminase n=1 Tax=Microvirga rosea TaxID=2715425 RepID=UPI002221326E|nr:chemotaxis response regulator protein-glutamate methylesterase [Microvirga rosea]